MMADHIDGQLREALQQHGLVTGPHGFLDFGEDEDIGHGKFRETARWYSACGRTGGTVFGYDGGKAVARMVGLR